jgi:hypothetical protein
MEIIMRSREERWYQLTDKAWEAIRRCLADGSFDYRATTPLHRCILSGENLYEGRTQAWYVGYTRPDDVREVAAALRPIDEGWMRQRYWAINPEEYWMALSEEDFEYTWQWFLPLREFYQRAAGDGRGVLFKAELH